ncbi:hypothetical protein OS493_037904 [Desmophyllum pertusum]|uniref:Uncharacterized protein n=1 Tax=Desmophyllum pertusum TaxID=174260 RepID=A0A9X0CUE4_9CNID|nr:hypothetical protein OS493_037904 [Desmophyllum pertusum]
MSSISVPRITWVRVSCAVQGFSNLPELAICADKPEGDSSCEAGLSCVLTKELIYKGTVSPVKQCMPEGVEVEVETVDLDNQVADAPMRNKRFLGFNGCSDPLPELEACNKQEGDCSCEAGLSCVLTKELIYKGTVSPVKQCMPEGVEVEVETVDLDNQVADAPMRNKRWLFFNRCNTEEDCSYNRCCAFGRRCLPKLRKYFTCMLTGIHNCGCADGLTCTETASITLPISGIRLALRQCRDE